MNEPRPHLNERDPDDRITKKDLKEMKLLPIPIRCTFLFGGSIIETSWLSMLRLEQFHVG